jgi:hypothetical protein
MTISNEIEYVPMYSLIHETILMERISRTAKICTTLQNSNCFKLEAYDALYFTDIYVRHGTFNVKAY